MILFVCHNTMNNVFIVIKLYIIGCYQANGRKCKNSEPVRIIYGIIIAPKMIYVDSHCFFHNKREPITNNPQNCDNSGNVKI